MARIVVPPGVSDKNKERLGKAVGYYAAATAAWETAQQIRDWYRSKKEYSLTIRETDDLYDDVHRWVLGLMPVESKHTIVKTTEAFVPESRWSSGGGDYKSKVNFLHDDSRSRLLNINGHEIRVVVEKNSEDVSLKEGRISLKPDAIVFYSQTPQGYKMVAEEIRSLATNRFKVERKPALWMLASYGDWSKRDDLPQRSLSSVVLKAGQAEALAADLQMFLDQEEDYVKRGIPWHRGYLLYGPPGTGKTSVAKALAAHHGLDLWYAPLGDLEKDTSLINVVGRVRARGVLLLEDIDTLHAATDREDEKGMVSMSALLNALDGVATPHGLITIMTTNDLDAIDAAILRAGRMDKVEEIGLPDDEQINRLFEVFYGQKPGEPFTAAGEVSTADIVEVFKANMNDPDEAELVLRNKLLEAGNETDGGR